MLRSFFKRLLRRPAVQAVIGAVAAFYIRLVYATTRWTRRGQDAVERLNAEGGPVLLCFWHGRFLMLGPGWPFRRRTHMLISQHPDGRLIARTNAHFGIRTIAGSTSRGGSGALRAMLRALETGDMVGITPDGPRGPGMRASPGAVSVARLAGATIVPMTYSTTACRRLRTWDRFMLPFPFGRGVILIGEPLPVAREAGRDEQARLVAELERRLNTLTDEADRLCGHPAVTPTAMLAREHAS